MQSSLLLLNIALLSFASGLILNFMPCVLPIVGIKIAGFSKIKSRLDVKMLTIFTSLGILTFCTLLSLPFIFVKNLSWGFQLQSPSFISLLILIFANFILVLRGDVDITPSFTIGHFKSYILEGFVSGFLIVVFSLSCIAPVVASALSLTFASNNSFMIFVCLFCMGLGLSVPYLLVGFFNIKIGFKNGSIFVNFAKVFSFVAIGATLLYLIFILQSQINVYLVTLVIIWSLLIVYLIYKFKSFYILLIGLVVTVLIPFANVEKKENYNNSIPFSEARLESYLNRGFSVMIAMEAAWCVICKTNAIAVINTKEFKTFLSQENIIFMKGDVTVYNQDIANFMSKFNAHGVPFYVIFTPFNKNGHILPVIFTTESLKNEIYNLNK